jgi:glycine cleavage system H protein
MMTGYSTVENAVAFLKEGAVDFLPKPFTFEELLSPVLRASRYLGLCATKPAERPADGSYRLGIGSWARAEADGTVRLGVTDTFMQIAGPIVEFELPKIEAQVVQGGVLAHALAQDGLRHTAWSPLGGRVTGVNQAAAENLKSAAPDPQGAGWLLKIVPSRFDRELLNLS